MEKSNLLYKQYMYNYPHKTAYGNIDNININDLKKNIDQNTDIYFHIPFCSTKCGYCNLFSVVVSDKSYFDLYLNSIKRQINQYALKKDNYKSLIIGGGTPLILNIKQLEKLFYIINNNILHNIHNTYSIIETSPNQTNMEKLNFLKKVGINRVSIGVQSFFDEELKSLKRFHNRKSVLNSLELLKNLEFDCLNIDLIYGIQNQTIEALKTSIDTALNFDPQEIFIYPLYIKPQTILYKAHYKRNDNIYNMYLFLSNYLKEKGFFQISMRRFTKNNYHNETCGFENTIAFGCGGRSYIGNVHFCSEYSCEQKECLKIINNFIERDDYTKIKNGYILNLDEQKRRYIIKNLFYINGISINDYYKSFKTSILDDYNILLDKLHENKYISINNSKIILTELGLSLSDCIGTEFISEEVKNKMKLWKRKHEN